MNIMYIMKVTTMIKLRNKNIKNKTRDGKIINKSFIEYASRVLFKHVLEKDSTNLWKFCNKLLGKWQCIMNHVSQMLATTNLNKAFTSCKYSQWKLLDIDILLQSRANSSVWTNTTIFSNLSMTNFKNIPQYNKTTT